jgi:hypothetical protein
MRGKPLRGRTAMAHDHTTDTRIAAPRDYTPLATTPHATTLHAPPQLGCDTSRVTIGRRTIP